MARIETPKDHRFPWYARAIFWMQKRHYGAVLKPARLWARSPRVFLALSLLYGAIDRRSSPLEPALRALVTVRVSQINDCPYCVDINSGTALKHGISEEKLALLSSFADSDLYAEREKAALSYAEAVTLAERTPADAHFRRLREHFDDDSIIELTALIAFQNLSSKFNAALGVEPQGFCAVAPLPAATRARRES